MSDLDGRRLLVVGASASVGRAIAASAAARGARVVAAARRLHKLQELAAEVGPSLIALECDACDPVQCQTTVDRAVRELGGLDAVVYTPALVYLRALDSLTADDWRRTFDTNVLGAITLTQAALPALRASRGRALYFVSDSTHTVPHWIGLAAYAVTKVALDKLALCWRYEEPDVCFTVVELGGTEGSEAQMNAGWTAEDTERFVTKWLATGNMPPTLLKQEVVAEQVLNVLASPAYVERLTIGPSRSADRGSLDDFDDLAGILTTGDGRG